MGVKGKRAFTKDFKLEAVRYRNEHPELTTRECVKNLDIGESKLSKWVRQEKSNLRDSFRGNGNYISEEAKENAKLRKENKTKI